MPIDSHLTYLQKHAFAAAQILQAPAPELGLVVVIPCHDEPELISCLESLRACASPGHATEVIVVMSSSDETSPEIIEQMQLQYETAIKWAEKHSTYHLQFHILHFPNLPKKHAGIGLTRKIGMDEAVGRLNWAEQPDAPIASLDADCFVDQNYLIAIRDFFLKNRKLDACSIRYAFAQGQHKSAILRIELANRSLIAGLQFACHPYAFPTFGGAMAVRCSGYEAQAGMNRRKTGEDFDFLQKFIELGKLGMLEETEVSLSDRISRRKPGGIGNEIAAYLEKPNPDFPVFALESYKVLKSILAQYKNWYHLNQEELNLALAELPPVFQEFLRSINGESAIWEVKTYTKDPKSFEKRFFRWFNSLRCFQFLRFASENGIPKENLSNHLQKLLPEIGIELQGEFSLELALEALRK